MNNSNINPADPQRDDFMRQLADLAPARVPGDGHQVFYQAGYRAATEHYRRQSRSSLRWGAAACLLLCSTIGLAAYEIGRRASASLANRSQLQSPTPSLPQAAQPNPPDLLVGNLAQPSSTDRTNVSSAQPATNASNSVPNGLLTSWLTSSLVDSAERPVGLVGANHASYSNTAATAELPLENSSPESSSEKILQRRNWQDILPTL